MVDFCKFFGYFLFLVIGYGYNIVLYEIFYLIIVLILILFLIVIFVIEVNNFGVEEFVVMKVVFVIFLERFNFLEIVFKDGMKKLL